MLRWSTEVQSNPFVCHQRAVEQSEIKIKAVECLLQQTSATDAEREAIGARVAAGLTVPLDPGVTGPLPELAHSAHLAINPVNQMSDSQLTNQDYALGCFEDVIKVEDSFTPSFEIESGIPDSSTVSLCVKERLKDHVQFWEGINTPLFIIDCIREGYKIPFYVTPPVAAYNNNCSALKHSEFVLSAILE
ncbi:hypothetical protein OS493_022708 [Desmophyllum pertusum]|uniref:Uncharacterized protein n=1 Tax=Desmophyllum pertusum TaxID=174260 RepID=A0A9W9YAI4_9CNID|nr:hypothetical protein OS493_022708 [Desmophyllum pertusum]